MLKNYIKIAIRNIQRQKVFSFINITGLSVGMACCMLIFLFIRDELSYDQFHVKKDRIYRLLYDSSSGITLARAPITIQPLMQDFFPEVEMASRVFVRNASVSIKAEEINSKDDKSFEETDLFFADDAFTEIFTLEAIAGDKANWLVEPYTVVLDEASAIKYFGSTDVLNKTIYLRGDRAFKVNGVVKDFPANSHMHFNMLLPFDNMFDIEEDSAAVRIKANLNQNWVISHSHTFVLLKEGANPTAVDSRTGDLVNTHAPERLRLGQSYRLQPIEKVHLHSSDIYLNPEAQGDIQYIYVFGGIALITLLIACFNFINLSTAQSMQRAKEVGMRKVMGAGKKHLFIQFLGESMLICLFGFVLSLGLVNLALPKLNELTGKSLELTNLLNTEIVLSFIGIFLITGILGGSYPAFYISRVNMITTLKGKVSDTVGKKINFRQFLVIVQFAASIVLITGSLLIFKQLNYLLNRPVGFNTALMLNVPLFSQNINTLFGGVDGPLRHRLNTFEEELERFPEIQKITLSSNLPGIGSVSRMVTYEGKETTDPIFVPSFSVDYDFIETYSLNLVAGRDFDIDMGTDHTNAFIINEQAAKEFNFGKPNEAIGKEITLEGKTGQVIGVVKDFHYTSLRSAIGSMIMDVQVSFFSAITMRLNTRNPTATIALIEEKWKEFFPEKTFEYSFIDESLASNYENERRLGNIIGIFASLAILVSCLGSYGLIMYNAKRREKEIGVRKVLGANFRQVIILMFKDFTILYLISFLLAIPFIYYFADSWLSDFDYKIGLSVDVFLISGILTLMIVWFTISYQSIKSAMVNPIKCLRDE